MAKKTHKEQLFDNFFVATSVVLESLEEHFLVSGVVDQVFGKDAFGQNSNEALAKDKLRASNAWKEMSALYEYAVNGVVDPDYDTEQYADRSYIVTNGAQITELLASGVARLSKEWTDLYCMGDGRFCLDGGSDVMVSKLALLANVDLRTVRNAASSGQLATRKSKNFLEGDAICAENASARRWLIGRKGFKPTLRTNNEREQIGDINDPSGFASFLIDQRLEIESELDANDVSKRSVNHPSVNQEAIKQLEAGVFALPLDAVFPIADYYQVEHKKLLECVMRVFFSEELSMLASDTPQAGEQK